MKRVPLTLALSILLVSSLGSCLQVVRVARSNFYMPPAETVWNIHQPQKNSSYGINYIDINFTVETNLGLLYFYSLDGQEKQEINTTTISKIPLPQYPPFIDGSLWTRRTEQASTQLPYLSKGNHTLTIFQIYPLSPDSPQKGNVVSQISISFSVNSNLPINPSPSTKPTALPIPSPSITPSTPSITPHTNDQYFFLIPSSLTSILSLVLILSVASVSLVYLRRRKKQ